MLSEELSTAVDELFNDFSVLLDKRKNTNIFFEQITSKIASSAENSNEIYSFLNTYADTTELKVIFFLDILLSNLLNNLEISEKSKISYTLLELTTLIEEKPLSEPEFSTKIYISICKAALIFFTRDKFPSEWAILHGKLGDAYRANIWGDIEKNIEKSIFHTRESLKVFTEGLHPEQWAVTQWSLSASYAKRLSGDEENNIELSILARKSALRVFEKTKFPEEWALTWMSLAELYEKRLVGTKQQNIEYAIGAYESVLSIFTKTNSPENWAHIKGSLAFLYQERISDNKKKDLEQAIRLYNESLTIYTQDAFPDQHGAAKALLAELYLQRIKGDPEHNNRESVKAYQEAIALSKKTGSSLEQYKLEADLAVASSRLKEQDAIEKSIIRCKEVLAECNQYNSPKLWAGTQGRLGLLYSSRSIGYGFENINLAIKAFKKASKVFRKHRFLREWSVSQHNLGECYLKRYSGWLYADRFHGGAWKNTKLAIQYFELALTVRTKENFPLEWAETHQALSNAYLKRMVINGINGVNSQRGDTEIAIRYCLNALEIHQPEIFPELCLQSSNNLGSLYFSQKNWPKAIQAYETAVTALDYFRSEIEKVDRRQEILNDADCAYSYLIQACINNKQYDLAATYIDKSKSRRVAELISTEKFQAQEDVSTASREILNKISQVEILASTERQKVRKKLEDSLPSTQEKEVQQSKSILCCQVETVRAVTMAASEVLKDLEQQRKSLYTQLKVVDPATAAQALNFESLVELLDAHTALLSFFSTRDATYALILLSNGQTFCHTCSVTDFQTCTREELLRKEELLQAWLEDHWIAPYIKWSTSPEELKKENEQWKENLSDNLLFLSEKLRINELIEKYLQGIDELIIIPHRRLHTVPFAAIPLESGTYLGERFIIRYVPSGQILSLCMERPQIDISQLQYGVVENPTSDLNGASLESQAFSQLFNVDSSNHLIEEDATAHSYRKLIGRVNNLLSSHHASARVDVPEESALVLANDDQITLHELLSPDWRFNQLNEVCLSCCETGFSKSDSPMDEFLSLGTGFLCAGARTVISSLWMVDDVATMFFFIQYFTYKAGEGMSSKLALQQAQIYLKSITGAQIRTWCQQQREDTETIYSRRKALKKKLKQFPQNSKEYTQIADQIEQLNSLRFTKEEVVKNIESTGISDQKYPFASPYYWSAFRCEGVG